MKGNYIAHITLNTAHTAVLHFDQGRQLSVDSVALELGRAVRDGQTDILLGRLSPEPPHYQLKATAVGPSVICSVFSPVQHAPLVTFGVARKSRGARQLWSALHEQIDGLRTDLADVPSTPWLATRIEASAIFDLAAFDWLADYQQLVAWAWVQKLTTSID
jgi:hypothetical protein